MRMEIAIAMNVIWLCRIVLGIDMVLSRVRVGCLVGVGLFGMLEVVIGDRVYMDEGIVGELFEDLLKEFFAFGDGVNVSGYVYE